MVSEQRKVSEGRVTELDSASFKDFLKRNKFAVVDFWAEWCAPCFILSPVLEELSEDYSQVAFGKINVDENKDVAAEYGIMSLPTVLFFKDGEVVDEVVGAVPREVVEIRLKSLLK
ncbi:thiol reductase thioredoxin [Sulfodiicoccus acidiphilus]|uniref:Thiol reductase thioredoxin n=1 Tax=Sulfodiicoccus acidiphilus TaxID=1670455 RepID=A0A348B2E5_9CREN|nr:thioredoxin [Sulfodiicoccus acidiphilus]BBD72347.1 thiol reductase thioredoxin [Sulfodiicoccus acidiphilus]GGT90120.1 thiol reductase thioredoxin [Sulfodiicoccus acidiphilus]